MPDEPLTNDTADSDAIAGWAGSANGHLRPRPTIDPQRAFDHLVEGQRLLYRTMKALQDEVAATLKVMKGRFDAELATIEYGLERRRLLAPEAGSPDAAETDRTDPLDADEPLWTTFRRRLRPERLADLERNRRLMVIRREELRAANALRLATRDTVLALDACLWPLFERYNQWPDSVGNADAPRASLPLLEGPQVLDWSRCPAVVPSRDEVGGPWLLWGTNVPAAEVFEALEAGASLDDLLARHKDLNREQVQGVLRFAAMSLRPAATRS